MKHGAFSMMLKSNDRVWGGNSWHPTTQGSSHVEIV